MRNFAVIFHSEKAPQVIQTKLTGIMLWLSFGASLPALPAECLTVSGQDHQDPGVQFLRQGIAQDPGPGDPANSAGSIVTDTLDADRLVARSFERQKVGDYFNALTDLYAALRQYESGNDLRGMATVYNAIGTIHHYDQNYPEAGAFYARSLAIRRKLGPQEDIAVLYGNIGSLLEDIGRPDSALPFHRQNLEIRRTLGDRKWLAVCYSNLGSCMSKLGQSDSASHYLSEGLALIREIGDPRLVSITLSMLGQAYLQQDAPAKAIQACSEGLRLAKETNAMSAKEPCMKCLYQAYSRSGDYRKALTMLEGNIALRDSMFGKDNAKGLLKIEMAFAYKRRQYTDSLKRVEKDRQARFAYLRQIDDQRNQKRAVLFITLAVLGLSGALWNRLRFMRRSRNLVRQERDRSDALLLNILPMTIAEELKRDGHAMAREVEGVSILFTDFHEFTKLSERLSAQELVEGIDTCYRAFDSIAMRHGLEKIKTIGDAYMCAGGLPEPRKGSVRNTVLAALAMQEWLQQHAFASREQGKPVFRMRAGIHTGPVVAGIVGKAKFQYDVWGDTVNIAARFVSAGEVGEVNISEATYAILCTDPRFTFIPRGKIMTKGKGEMEMFFVRRQTGKAGGQEGEASLDLDTLLGQAGRAGQ